MDPAKEFLDHKNIFAVVGVSENLSKYGRIIYDKLKETNYEVYPINPRLKTVASDKCYPSLIDLPVVPDVVSFVVPPHITLRVLNECVSLNITKVWFQPGSDSKEAITFCRDNRISCLRNQCVLLKLD